MQQNGHLKSLYPRVLSVQAYKHQNYSDDWPEVGNSGSLGLLNLAVRGAHFEPTVGMFTNQTKGHDLTPLKTKFSSSISYK
jgi:hypothetical protein